LESGYTSVVVNGGCLIVYISVSAVTAAYGFAFTATPFCKRPKGTKTLCPSIRCLALARHAVTKALLRGRLPRHPCRGSPCATPAFGLWERGGRSGAKARATSKANATSEITAPPVGASLLAMDPQASGSSCPNTSSLTTFASKLAPTGECVFPNQAGLQAAVLLILIHRPHGAGPERGSERNVWSADLLPPSTDGHAVRA
jgi:hypothetical protein